MKKVLLLLYAFLFGTGLTMSYAQNTWVQKSDFGGTKIAAAVGFSIGNKGYIGTGTDFENYLNGFWEYDPATNAWTQRADVGGTGRDFAVGFSIGSKGYIGTGESFDGTFHFYNDFWEYDPLTNSWIQKADFGGSGRASAVGFSIGNKGYIGTGYFYDGTDHYYKDFWEYDPATDTWTQKADFGGTARFSSVGFSIGSKGYIGIGFDDSEFPDYLKKDFWEYDPATNEWVEKASFGGTARYCAVGFSIGSKGYIGTGWDGLDIKNDFWEYDPAQNAWDQKADYGGGEICVATGFSTDSKGYIGTGNTFNGYKKDFWEYTPETIVAGCPSPATALSVNVTSNQATLKWIGINEALSYKLRYKVEGNAEWIINKSLDNHKTLYGLAPGTEYTWQVKSFCDIKPVVASDWSEKQFFTTDDLRLSASVDYEMMFSIYPNPVSSSSTVSFFLTEESNVTIELMDVTGRSLRIIVKKNFSSGSHEVTFKRELLIAGIYFLQMKTNEGVRIKNMVIK